MKNDCYRFESHIMRLLRHQTDDKTARVTKASGALFEKGDGIHKDYHIECKHTADWPIKLQWNWWETCSQQAEDINRIPCLVIGIGPARTPGTDIFFLLPTTEQPTHYLDWKSVKSKTIHNLSIGYVKWNDEYFEILSFPTLEGRPNATW